MASDPTSVRPASTVVVLRPRELGSEPEVFMLRRSSRSAFMPDALVFPGGALEPEDSVSDTAADLNAAYARAACRECMEEASLALDVERLHWFDTWQTPSGESPRRFLARFYFTTLAADQGHDARADGAETQAGRWATASTILADWASEQVDLPPPTLCILLQLADSSWQRWLERDAERVSAPILPKISAVGSTIQIVMPHDPGYAELPGETLPPPTRAHELPCRFVRQGKRWVPET